MNLKIVIEERGTKSIRATMYITDTHANIGTLWMTHEEFEQFHDMLTFGMNETCTLEVEDNI